MPKDTPSRSNVIVLATYRWLLRHGNKPVALRPHSKAALSKGYEKYDYAAPPEDVWLGGDLGIGVKCGPKSGGHLDADLDCAEAVFFAPLFLPLTDAVFGRKSKPSSHYFY